MATEYPWDEIEQAYVTEGMEPQAICAKFFVPRILLGQQVATGGWRKKREELLKRSAADTLGLDGHEFTADELVALGKSIAVELRNAGEDQMKTRVVRSRAEAYRTLVEATDRAVRLARDVRGIRLGAPSREQEAEPTRVTYEVTVKRPEEGEGVAATG